MLNILVTERVMVMVIAHVARSQASLHHHFWANLVAVVSLSEQSEKVDEKLGKVEVHGAELAGGIILRERVMVVVEAFAAWANAYKHVLDRIDVLVVRFEAPHVRHAVHQPCDVQCENVTQQARNEVAVQQSFVPEQGRHHGRHHEAAQKGQAFVVSIQNLVRNKLILFLMLMYSKISARSDMYFFW